MNISDPDYLEYLRDLPSGYLLDLLSDNEDIDQESLYWVLQERGLDRQEIENKLQRRRNSRWPRPYMLWKTFRWLTILNTLIVTYFNISGFYQLLHSNHAFKVGLVLVSVGCVLCGFFVGFKLTSHLYQGGKSLVFCGFPIPVGYLDLQTGEEILPANAFLIMRMALNAMVGVSLTLFPLIFIYIMID